MKVIPTFILILIAMQLLIMFTDLPHQLPSRAGKRAVNPPFFYVRLTSSQAANGYSSPSSRQRITYNKTTSRYLQTYLILYLDLRTPHTPLKRTSCAVSLQCKVLHKQRLCYNFPMNKQIPTELLKLELRKLQIKVAEESRSNFLTFVKKVFESS